MTLSIYNISSSTTMFLLVHLQGGGGGTLLQCCMNVNKRYILKDQADGLLNIFYKVK